MKDYSISLGFTADASYRLRFWASDNDETISASLVMQPHNKVGNKVVSLDTFYALAMSGADLRDFAREVVSNAFIAIKACSVFHGASVFCAPSESIVQVQVIAWMRGVTGIE